MLGAWAGKLFGKKDELRAEKTQVSDKLNFFRDMAISISLIMIIVAFVIAAILAVVRVGVAAFETDISGGQNWLVFTLIQALSFTAGVLVLLQGVRMLIGEIVPAFKGIAERAHPRRHSRLGLPGDLFLRPQFPDHRPDQRYHRPGGRHDRAGPHSLARSPCPA